MEQILNSPYSFSRTGARQLVDVAEREAVASESETLSSESGAFGLPYSRKGPTLFLVQQEVHSSDQTIARSDFPGIRQRARFVQLALCVIVLAAVVLTASFIHVWYDGQVVYGIPKNVMPYVAIGLSGLVFEMLCGAIWFQYCIKQHINSRASKTEQ